MKRRDFLAIAGLSTTGIGLTNEFTYSLTRLNKIPKWKGFNMLVFLILRQYRLL